MKRLSRVLLIGLLHSTVYLWLLPNVIKPNFSEKHSMIVTIITSLFNIALTVAIVRLPAILSRRKAEIVRDL